VTEVAHGGLAGREDFVRVSRSIMGGNDCSDVEIGGPKCDDGKKKTRETRVQTGGVQKGVPKGLNGSQRVDTEHKEKTLQ